MTKFQEDQLIEMKTELLQNSDLNTIFDKKIFEVMEDEKNKYLSKFDLIEKAYNKAKKEYWVNESI